MAKLNKDRIFKAADGYIRSGKVAKAIAEYEKWVAANPKDTNTLRNVGDLYARLGKNAQAIKYYTQVADLYRSDGFNVRAIATHKMILRLDPQNEAAMASLADLQVAQGLLMEAKAQYQTLVELYNKSGQKKRATEVFKKLAEIDPADLKVRYKYAEFLDRQGQAAEAIAEYVGIADEFINNGQVSEAILIMEKGLRIDSFNRALRCKLAQASILQGDYAKAVQLLNEIRGKYPQDKEILSRLGEAYMGAGNLGEAESVFSRLAELEPDDPEHASRRAELAVGQGDHDRALELLNPVVDNFVDHGEGDKAAALLQKVLSKEPHHIKTLVKLAEIHTVLKQEQARLSAYDQLCEAYSQHGNYEKAVHVAEQLVELDPENSQHKDRLRFLKSRLGAEVIVEEPVEAAADVELPGLESIEVTDEIPQPEAVVRESVEMEPPPALEFGVIPTLSAEDEEHIKEKMTEAEVFVRYGLVDKAVDQLKDVLESFPFHTGAREKLIEVYKEQGMNREAADQLVELSRTHQQLGEDETASEVLREARMLDPALAASAEPATEVATEEEIELTLAPEEELQAADLGSDFMAESMAQVMEDEPLSEVVPARPVDLSEESSPQEEVELTFEGSEELPIDVGLEGQEALAAEPAGLTYEEELTPEDELPDEMVVGEGLAGVDEEDEVPVVVEDEEVVVIDEEVPIAEEGAIGEGVTEVSEEASPAFGMGDEAEIELRVPATELATGEDLFVDEVPPEAEGPRGEREEEVEVLAVDEEDEEISVELPDLGDIGVVDEVEIPRISEQEPLTPPLLEPEQAAEPQPPVGGTAVASELQEVDEYISLGLYEDARDSLRELLRERPGDPRIRAKIEELGFSVSQIEKEVEQVVDEEAPSAEFVSSPVGGTRPEPAGVLETDETPQLEEPLASIEDLAEPEPLEAVFSFTTEAGSEPFVDLASALSDEMFGTQSAVQEGETVEEPAGAIDDPGLDEIFREFKKGVEKQLGTEDYDTRYNLGIAYKEMGLLDEAIAEFQLASKDESRLLECCSMLGLCFLEKGMPEIAIKWFEKGLSAPGRSEEEYHGLQYDLALAHQAAGDPERALELYMNIYHVNARFRDVKDRVRDLQEAKN